MRRKQNVQNMFQLQGAVQAAMEIAIFHVCMLRCTASMFNCFSQRYCQYIDNTLSMFNCNYQHGELYQYHGKYQYGTTPTDGSLYTTISCLHVECHFG